MSMRTLCLWKGLSGNGEECVSEGPVPGHQGSKARFFSILVMIALGVGFFSGIDATKPDMVLSADAYYKDYNLANFRIYNPFGYRRKTLQR